jgi:hypothetical protein
MPILQVVAPLQQTIFKNVSDERALLKRPFSLS